VGLSVAHVERRLPLWKVGQAWAGSLSMHEAPTAPVETRIDGYRYESFRTRHMLADLRFSSASTAPGCRLAPVSLPVVGGGRTSIGGPRDRPLVLITGSLTCPMTEASTPTVVDLHRDYGDRADFVLLSVREAHPGERLPQPLTQAGTETRAAELAAHHGVPFTVAIDTLDGVVHRQLDAKPNTVAVIDRDGVVVFRSMWASSERALRGALDTIVDGDRPPRDEDRAMLGPMASALPGIPAVMDRGGPKARRDLRRGAPPMAMMAWIARRVPLPGAKSRGMVAMLVPVMVTGVAVAALIVVFR
jgi:hypothetical protein